MTHTNTVTLSVDTVKK